MIVQINWNFDIKAREKQDCLDNSDEKSTSENEWFKTSTGEKSTRRQQFDQKSDRSE